MFGILFFFCPSDYQSKRKYLYYFLFLKILNFWQFLLLNMEELYAMKGDSAAAHDGHHQT